MGGRGASFQSHINSGDNIIIDDGNGTIGGMEEEKDDPESEIHNKPFLSLKDRKFSTRQSTDDLTNKELLEPHQNQMKNLLDDYKSIYSHITFKDEVHLKSNNSRPRAFGWVRTGAEDGKLVCNLTLNHRFYAAGKEHIEEETRKAISVNHFVKVDKNNCSKYVVTHEMGHVLENALINKLARASKEPKTATMSSYASKIRSDVIDIYNSKYKTNGSSVSLSRYSGTNDYEWFAETFTNLKLSSKPEPIALAMKEYLDKNNK